MLPVITEWWNFGLCKKSGYEEMLANCSSFFLTYALADPEGIPEELIVRALERFPPADRAETVTMCESVLTIAAASGTSVAMQAAIAKGIARLLTETEANKAKRKLDQAILGKLLELLRAIMANEQIAEQVLQEFRKYRTKLAQLHALLAA
jgi:hypothetical protein